MDDSGTELLVRLLSRHQEELFRYIFALLPHEADARDILQETSVALFRKLADYDAAKPFLPWAYRFAELEVLKYRERHERRVRLLDLDLVQRLARERAELDAQLHTRLQALDHCLQQLPPADRDLIRHRYQERLPIEEIVLRTGASRRTLFRSLHRVRRLLLECIDHHVEGT